MKKSCVYCGKIHEKNFECGKKPIKVKKKYEKDKFRSSYAWQQKTLEIRERDNYICQICIRTLYNTRKRLNSKSLSIHHAIPLKDDYEKRLDNDNLLTVCDMHHEMAESGEIPYKEIKRIIDEQEMGVSPGE